LEDIGGIPQGTGFVLGPTLAVTCVHVIQACGAGPGQQVSLTFQASGTSAKAVVPAEGWHPEADVAFLRLPEALPEGVTPARLGPSESHVERDARVHSFGYPEVGQVSGLWGKGEFLGEVKEAGQPLLQLSSAQITVGFSGAPVWDDRGLVIGMLAQIALPDRYARLEDVAFAIPAERLRALAPDQVALHTRPPMEWPLADLRPIDALRRATKLIVKPVASALTGRPWKKPRRRLLTQASKLPHAHHLDTALMEESVDDLIQLTRETQRLLEAYRIQPDPDQLETIQRWAGRLADLLIRIYRLEAGDVPELEALVPDNE
jgi:hypothetical protein